MHIKPIVNKVVSVLTLLAFMLSVPGVIRVGAEQIKSEVSMSAGLRMNDWEQIHNLLLPRQAVQETQFWNVINDASRLSPNGTLLLHEQKVTASDYWPVSVAISGDTAVFGSRWEECVYIYVRIGGVWIYQTTLTASDPLSESYGYSVAISNDTVLVSSLTTNIFEHNMGSVYIYTRSGTTWTEQARLFASDGAEGDDYGISVSISGDTALVGAYKDDSAVVVDRGSVYIYVRSGTSWSEQAHFYAPDGANNDHFGTSVSVNGDTALIGAEADDEVAIDQGSAYVFVRSGTSWNQQAKLIAQDGAQADSFGVSVALDGDTALVGSPGDDIALTDEGSAYVFTRSGSSWSQQAKLTAVDGRPVDYFGSSVALSGDKVLIGAYGDDDDVNDEGNLYNGSAYFYGRVSGMWNQLHKFTAPDRSVNPYEGYGEWVALSSDTVLIGSDVGAAYFKWYSTPPGFYVSNGMIFEKNGDRFIMRGINYPFAFYKGNEPPTDPPTYPYDHSFADIKATGANTIRVVLSNGKYQKSDGTYFLATSQSEVQRAIELCYTNRLVCILEVHDTTGYGDTSDGHLKSSTLSEAVDYWVDIKSILDGTESYVILNLGNEPYGNVNPGDWVTATTNAIQRMRTKGFQHMLMVDAPNWGQDNSSVMKDNAASVLTSDPQRNTVFSIHMYRSFFLDLLITDYLDYFVTNKLPIVIGEFGYYHTLGDPNENTIMSYAQSHGIGYLGWSWSGNDSANQYLDMVTNFTPGQRTGWGNRVIAGVNGICPTSYEASVFGGVPGTRRCSVVLSSVGTNDGWILESGENSNAGGLIDSASTTINLGDNGADKQYRSILSFDTSVLPNTAAITKVTLKIKKMGMTGTNPFNILGKLKIDIRKPYFGAGIRLAAGDFQAPVSKAGVGTFGTTPVSNWYSSVLGTAGYPYINKTGTTQFRLYFAVDDDDDMGADYMKFFSGNYSSVSARPMLIIEFYMP